MSSVNQPRRGVGDSRGGGAGGKPKLDEDDSQTGLLDLEHIIPSVHKDKFRSQINLLTLKFTSPVAERSFQKFNSAGAPNRLIVVLCLNLMVDLISYLEILVRKRGDADSTSRGVRAFAIIGISIIVGANFPLWLAYLASKNSSTVPSFIKEWLLRAPVLLASLCAMCGLLCVSALASEDQPLLGDHAAWGTVFISTLTTTFLRLPWPDVVALLSMYSTGIVSAAYLRDECEDSRESKDCAYYSVIILSGFVLNMIACYTGELSNRKSYLLHHRLRIQEKKSLKLLHNILPPRIADRFRSGELVLDDLEHISIMFVSITNFDSLVGSFTSPRKLFKFLNRLYSAFDRIIPTDLYKVEHINGDYIVASKVLVQEDKGVQNKRWYKQQSATLLFNLAFQFLYIAERFNKRLSNKGAKLELKVGVNSGPCVAGIIGSSRTFFRVFGDTMNTAARMYLHGAPGRVHVSEATAQLVKGCDDFFLEDRGVMQVKGKGAMRTYYVNQNVIDDRLSVQLPRRQSDVPRGGGGDNGGHHSPSSRLSLLKSFIPFKGGEHALDRSPRLGGGARGGDGALTRGGHNRTMMNFRRLGWDNSHSMDSESSAGSKSTSGGRKGGQKSSRPSVLEKLGRLFHEGPLFRSLETAGSSTHQHEKGDEVLEEVEGETEEEEEEGGGEEPRSEGGDEGGDEGEARDVVTGLYSEAGAGGSRKGVDSGGGGLGSSAHIGTGAEGLLMSPGGIRLRPNQVSAKKRGSMQKRGSMLKRGSMQKRGSVQKRGSTRYRLSSGQYRRSSVTYQSSVSSMEDQSNTLAGALNAYGDLDDRSSFSRSAMSMVVEEEEGERDSSVLGSRISSHKRESRTPPNNRPRLNTRQSFLAGSRGGGGGGPRLSLAGSRRGTRCSIPSMRGSLTDLDLPPDHPDLPSKEGAALSPEQRVCLSTTGGQLSLNSTGGWSTRSGASMGRKSFSKFAISTDPHSSLKKLGSTGVLGNSKRRLGRLNRLSRPAGTGGAAPGIHHSRSGTGSSVSSGFKGALAGSAYTAGRRRTMSDQSVDYNSGLDALPLNALRYPTRGSVAPNTGLARTREEMTPRVSLSWRVTKSPKVPTPLRRSMSGVAPVARGFNPDRDGSRDWDWDRESEGVRLTRDTLASHGRLQQQQQQQQWAGGGGWRASSNARGGDFVREVVEGPGVEEVGEVDVDVVEEEDIEGEEEGKGSWCGNSDRKESGENWPGPGGLEGEQGERDESGVEKDDIEATKSSEEIEEKGDISSVAFEETWEGTGLGTSEEGERSVQAARWDVDIGGSSSGSETRVTLGAIHPIWTCDPDPIRSAAGEDDSPFDIRGLEVVPEVDLDSSDSDSDTPMTGELGRQTGRLRPSNRVRERGHTLAHSAPPVLDVIGAMGGVEAAAFALAARSSGCESDSSTRVSQAQHVGGEDPAARSRVTVVAPHEADTQEVQGEAGPVESEEKRRIMSRRVNARMLAAAETQAAERSAELAVKEEDETYCVSRDIVLGGHEEVGGRVFTPVANAFTDPSLERMYQLATGCKIRRLKLFMIFPVSFLFVYITATEIFQSNRPGRSEYVLTTGIAALAPLMVFLGAVVWLHLRGKLFRRLYQASLIVQLVVLSTVVVLVRKDGNISLEITFLLIYTMMSGVGIYTSAPVSAGLILLVMLSYFLRSGDYDPSDTSMYEGTWGKLSLLLKMLMLGCYCVRDTQLSSRRRRVEWRLSNSVEAATSSAKRLLKSLLPEHVAKKLQKKERYLGESCHIVVLFSDICGFTPLSASMSPRELVLVLHQIYSAFDELVLDYDLYKMDTIGDAFIVVAFVAADDNGEAKTGGKKRRGGGAGGLPLCRGPVTASVRTVAAAAADAASSTSSFRVGSVESSRPTQTSSVETETVVDSNGENDNDGYSGMEGGLNPAAAAFAAHADRQGSGEVGRKGRASFHRDSIASLRRLGSASFRAGLSVVRSLGLLPVSEEGEEEEGEEEGEKEEEEEEEEPQQQQPQLQQQQQQRQPQQQQKQQHQQRHQQIHELWGRAPMEEFSTVNPSIHTASSSDRQSAFLSLEGAITPLSPPRRKTAVSRVSVPNLPKPRLSALSRRWSARPVGGGGEGWGGGGDSGWGAGAGVDMEGRGDRKPGASAASPSSSSGTQEEDGGTTSSTAASGSAGPGAVVPPAGAGGARPGQLTLMSEEVACRAMVKLGIEMQHTLADFRERSGLDVNMRVGIHMGKAVAGVIGKLQPRFHVYGTTMTCANALESTAEPGTLNMSAKVANVLNESEQAMWAQPRPFSPKGGKTTGLQDLLGDTSFMLDPRIPPPPPTPRDSFTSYFGSTSSSLVEAGGGGGKGNLSATGGLFDSTPQTTPQMSPVNSSIKSSSPGGGGGGAARRRSALRAPLSRISLRSPPGRLSLRSPVQGRVSLRSPLPSPPDSGGRKTAQSRLSLFGKVSMSPTLPPPSGSPGTLSELGRGSEVGLDQLDQDSTVFEFLNRRLSTYPAPPPAGPLTRGTAALSFGGGQAVGVSGLRRQISTQEVPCTPLQMDLAWTNSSMSTQSLAAPPPPPSRKRGITMTRLAPTTLFRNISRSSHLGGDEEESDPTSVSSSGAGGGGKRGLFSRSSSQRSRLGRTVRASGVLNPNSLAEPLVEEKSFEMYNLGWGGKEETEEKEEEEEKGGEEGGGLKGKRVMSSRFLNPMDDGVDTFVL